MEDYKDVLQKNTFPGETKSKGERVFLMGESRD
jgi:hypothetical protein